MKIKSTQIGYQDQECKMNVTLYKSSNLKDLRYSTQKFQPLRLKLLYTKVPTSKIKVTLHKSSNL